MVTPSPLRMKDIMEGKVVFRAIGYLCEWLRHHEED